MYFYDDAGSQIYQEITTLEEYYPTRTEHGILKSHKGAIAELLTREHPELWKSFNLVELGCGDGHKTQVLMDYFTSSLGLEVTYFPIDISEGALQSLVDSGFRAPRISPIVGQNLVGLSYVISQTTCPSLVLFLGSSIGNYDYEDAVKFIGKVQETLRVGDFLLIGFDLIKDLDVLYRAYFDSKGVTSTESWAATLTCATGATGPRGTPTLAPWSRGSSLPRTRRSRWAALPRTPRSSSPPGKASASRGRTSTIGVKLKTWPNGRDSKSSISSSKGASVMRC
jgi:hypothetical protein